MNADAFRHLYEYHFAANRKLWDAYITQLTSAQFTQKVEYSVGSIRNHVVHLMSVDDRWFSGLRGVAVPDFLNPTHYPNRDKIRAHWDEVEANMREYLATLQDAALFEKPFADKGEPFTLWQVLLHVANHGTDHRAQLQRLLHDVGIQTTAQDYFFYIIGRL
jgi:uncharacterized damage-inducible protein DinB